MRFDFVPTFRPSISEWNEGLEAYTRKYVENTPEVKRSGLARVIPPKEWKWLRKNAFENVKPITFKPIRQCTSTRAGVTRCQIQEMKTSTISEFETFVKKSHATPSNIEEKLKRNDNIIDEECIAMIERAFWKSSLSHTSKPGVYGADIKASLFQKDVEACGRGWNFSNLESILTRGLSKEERENLHGVASSYLYVGSWGSMFAWHTEDYELNSVNYIHQGKPKVWYSIPPAYAKRFESVAASLFAAESRECAEFLRHKTCMISPTKIRSYGIPVCRQVCYEGQLMITFPRTYHAGFNVGFNIAESTNFATASWIPLGLEAKHCKCQEKIEMREEQKRLKAGKRKRRRRSSSESVVKINVHRMLIRLRETYPLVFEQRPDLLSHLRNAEKLFADDDNGEVIFRKEAKKIKILSECCLPVVERML
eukprot:g233.t1